MINSVGGLQMMPGMMQRVSSPQQQAPTSEVGTLERAGNDLARGAQTARASECPVSAATEAKGMFVDIYA